MSGLWLILESMLSWGTGTGSGWGVSRSNQVQIQTPPTSWTSLYAAAPFFHPVAQKTAHLFFDTFSMYLIQLPGTYI